MAGTVDYLVLLTIVCKRNDINKKIYRIFFPKSNRIA